MPDEALTPSRSRRIGGGLAGPGSSLATEVRLLEIAAAEIARDPGRFAGDFRLRIIGVAERRIGRMRPKADERRGDEASLWAQRVAADPPLAAVLNAPGVLDYLYTHVRPEVAHEDARMLARLDLELNRADVHHAAAVAANARFAKLGLDLPVTRRRRLNMREDAFEPALEPRDPRGGRVKGARNRSKLARIEALKKSIADDGTLERSRLVHAHCARFRVSRATAYREVDEALAVANTR